MLSLFRTVLINSIHTTVNLHCAKRDLLYIRIVCIGEHCSTQMYICIQQSCTVVHCLLCVYIFYCVITRVYGRPPSNYYSDCCYSDCCIIVMRLSLWCMYYYKSFIEHSVMITVME